MNDYAKRLQEIAGVLKRIGYYADADTLSDVEAHITTLERSISVVQSAAKSFIAATDEQKASAHQQHERLTMAAADVAGERSANAILTDENEAMRVKIEALTKDAARWRHYRNADFPESVRLSHYTREALDIVTDAAIKAKEAGA